jgi:hypothetical protein
VILITTFAFKKSSAVDPAFPHAEHAFLTHALHILHAAAFSFLDPAFLTHAAAFSFLDPASPYAGHALRTHALHAAVISSAWACIFCILQHLNA